MGESADQFVTCPTCQKRFRWRADVVGKKFNCPCGAALTVPPQPGPATLGSAAATTPAPSAAPAATAPAPAAPAAAAPPPPPAAAAPKPAAPPAEPPVVKGTGANAILERPPREEEDEGTYDLADPDEPPETSNRPATLASTPAPAAAKPAAAAPSHAPAPKAAAAAPSPVAAPVKAAEPSHAAPPPAKPAAPAPAAASTGNITSLDAPIGLGGLTIRHDPKCPSCGNFVKAEAVICVNCGYQMQSGEKVKTEVTIQENAGSGGKGFKGAVGAVFGMLKRKKADDGAAPLVTAEPGEEGKEATPPAAAPAAAAPAPAAAEEKKDSKVKGLMGKITGAVKRK